MAGVTVAGVSGDRREGDRPGPALRILHVAERYPPAFGGTERHVAAVAAAQVRAGHRVVVATGRVAGEPARRIDGAGVDIRRFTGWYHRLGPLVGDAEHPFHPPVPDPGTVRALRSLVAELRPDVVHAHSWVAHAAAAAVRRGRGVGGRGAGGSGTGGLGTGGPGRLVVTLHDYGLTCARRDHRRLTAAGSAGDCPGPRPDRCLACAGRHYGRAVGTATVVALGLFRPLLGEVDAFVAVSRAVARRSVDEGLPAGRVHVVSPYVPPTGPIPPGRAPAVPAGDYVLYVGALAAHKGVDVLLDAYQRLADPPPLVLLGEAAPGWRRPLPAGVTAPGAVAPDDVRRALRHCVAAVVPSVWPETFGLVAVEALEAGAPVVASAVGALPEIVDDGVTGRLVPPGDPAALAEALHGVLDGPAARGAWAEAARRRAASFDGAAGLDALYRRLLAGR